MRRVFLTGFTALMLLHLAYVPASADELRPRGGLVIRYDGVGKIFAGIVADVAEANYERLGGELGFLPDGTITVILTSDDRRFTELTQGKLPEWSAAVAVGGDTIVMSPLEGHKMDLEHVLAHELVHCFIRSGVGDTHVPRWFHEGCAEVYSGRFGVRRTVYVSWKSLRGELMDFDDIENVFDVGMRDAGLAYDQSYIAVNRLMTVYGGDTPAGIIAAMRKDRDFPSAMYAVTGLWPSEFEQRYLDHIREAYGIQSLLSVIPGTWTTILLLAFLAFLVMKLRNRRTLKRWEREHDGNIMDFPGDW